jgi:hypothetical protein
LEPAKVFDVTVGRAKPQMMHVGGYGRGGRRTGHVLAAALVTWLIALALPGCDRRASEDEIAGSTSTAAGGSSGQGGDIGLTSSGPGGGAGGDELCGKAVAEVERDPIDVIVLLDRSQSMAGKWSKTIAALVGFVADEKSEGMTVGINFFPVVGSPDECEPTAYAQLALSMGELPEHAATLISGMNATTVGGQTPTWGALSGTYSFAEAHKKTASDREVIVVFASDGDPCCGVCANEDIDSLTALASAAHAEDIDTYVVAIEGSTLASLDKIAAAGGTQAALDITSDISLFAEKLEIIRHAALGCDYDIPPPPIGEELNPAEVNVKYTPGDGGSTQTFPRVDKAEDCDTTLGWHYDKPSEPSQIVLCPITCDYVAQDIKASVEVLFGCATIVK